MSTPIPCKICKSMPPGRMLFRKYAMAGSEYCLYHYSAHDPASPWRKAVESSTPVDPVQLPDTEEADHCKSCGQPLPEI